MTVKIIAEAGVNHNGDIKLAYELVDAACASGADIVKFQTFSAENLVTANAKKAAYQAQNTKSDASQLEMLKQLELSFSDFKKLAHYCDKRNIGFLSTAFDAKSLNFLLTDIGQKLVKIPSGELTNAPALLDHAKSGADIILSTGMATIGEIEDALCVLAYGFLADDINNPSYVDFKKAYASTKAQEVLAERVTLLHCTTEYPAQMSDINLRAMQTLGHTFGLDVGYSDHSEGIIVPVAATALGASVIEKHFTLDKTMDGPDHRASLEPDELKSMVDAIRQTSLALGSHQKVPQAVEIENAAVVRKSLVASRTIKAGEPFTKDNLDVKRPGTGVSPFQYWSYLGRPAVHEYEKGDVIHE